VLRPPDIVDGGRGARYGFSEQHRHLAEFTQRINQYYNVSRILRS
jgi:hypothetical protein